MSVMHFANALVWEIIGPAMAGPTGPCATPVVKVASSHHLYVSSLPLLNFGKKCWSCDIRGSRGIPCRLNPSATLLVIIKIMEDTDKNYGSIQLSCIWLGLMALTMNLTLWVIHCHAISMDTKATRRIGYKNWIWEITGWLVLCICVFQKYISFCDMWHVFVFQSIAGH